MIELCPEPGSSSVGPVMARCGTVLAREVMVGDWYTLEGHNPMSSQRPLKHWERGRQEEKGKGRERNRKSPFKKNSSYHRRNSRMKDLEKQSFLNSLFNNQARIYNAYYHLPRERLSGNRNLAHCLTHGSLSKVKGCVLGEVGVGLHWGHHLDQVTSVSSLTLDALKLFTSPCGAG